MKKPTKTEYTDSLLRVEPETFRIRNRSLNHSTTTFGCTMELDLFSTYKVTAESTQETSFIVSYSTETRGLSLI
jgi:hypothetical protein